MLINVLNKVIGPFGYKIMKDDFKERYAEFMDIYTFCKPYTMTSVERMFALYKGVEYVVKNNIPGDFVECGVWKGGSSMLIAMTLQKFGVSDRMIWMYDTFEGMSEPGKEDMDVNGNMAFGIWKSKKVQEKSGWCVSSLHEVQLNMQSTEYPMEKIKLVEGMVEVTIPIYQPDLNIALLRLDTDWYSSTKHELEFLFPMLVKGGIFIIDDYGHWLGSKKHLTNI